MSSNTNLDQISSSDSRSSINFKISTKHQHCNKTETSKSWPNLASESRPRLNFITSTKHQQQNSDQSLASKSRLNVNFKILTKHLCSKCKQKFYFRFSTSTSATVTTSTSFESTSLHARVTSVKSTRQEWVSELGSQLLTRVANDRTRVR